MTTATKKKSADGPPSPAGNRLFLLAIVGLLIVGAGVVALLATSRERAADVPATAEVTIEGDPIAEMGALQGLTTPDIDPAIGSTAPTLTGTGFDDEEITIEADGRPKVIYFLAHWCPHCQNEVPLVQELIDEGSLPEDLDVYAISTDVTPERGNFPPNAWLDREDFSPPTIRDDDQNSALRAFGAGGFPYVVYLDGDNNVIARSSGELGKQVIADIWVATAAS